MLRLGTRGSKLALAQANMVRARLAEEGFPCEIIAVKTSGDRIQDRALADAGGKGLFTKELEQALLNREIDLAVHSMKDVPTAVPEGLALAAILPREDPRDVFLSNLAPSLDALPRAARVGTGSVRRHAQIARARADLEILLLRGNVDTRLAKLDAGNYDAIVLAYAGLKRLGLQARATSILSTFLPALGQGAVGVEVRANDENTNEAVTRLNDAVSAVEIACERTFQSALDGSCRTPIAGRATYANGRLTFRGEVLAPDGSDSVETAFDTALAPERTLAEAERLGRDAGDALKPRAARWLTL